MSSSKEGRPRSRFSAHEALGRLRWPVWSRLGFLAWGDERSRLRGPGVEYADVREYQFGEDARLIDWNLSARSDRVFVRESHPDRGLDAWLIVDASASLDWGTAINLKRDSALEMASAAASLIARRGSRVGAIVFDSQVRQTVTPVTGRAGRLHLISRLQASLEAPRSGGTNGLAGALRHAMQVVQHPSLLLVISDFLGPLDWRRPMGILGQRHELVATRIVDPTELSIPNIGVVTFEDPETGRQLNVDTSDRRIRGRFQQAADEQSKAISAALRRARAEELRITTARPFLSQLIEYLNRRTVELSRARPLPAT